MTLFEYFMALGAWIVLLLVMIWNRKETARIEAERLDLNRQAREYFKTEKEKK